jgi:hypothetical protein
MNIKSRVKVVRVYLEDFSARKYEVIRIPRTTFNKSVKRKFDSWLALINKVRGLNYTARILTGNHLCHFCGGFVDGKNVDELCDYCKERFNVNLYTQIKKRDTLNDVPIEEEQDESTELYTDTAEE